MSDLKVQIDDDPRVPKGTILTLDIPEKMQNDDTFIHGAIDSYILSKYGKHPSLPDIRTADPTEDVGKQGLKGPVQSTIKPHQGNWAEENLNPVEGIRKVSKGVNRSLGAIDPPKGVPGPSRASEVVGGASDVLRGVGQMAAPLAPEALMASPARLAATMAGGMIAGSGTEAGLKTLNVDPGYAEAGGDIARVLAPGVATSPRLAAILQNIASNSPKSLSKYGSIPAMIGAAIAESPLLHGDRYTRGLLGGATGASLPMIASVPTAIADTKGIPLINPAYSLRDRTAPINAEQADPGMMFKFNGQYNRTALPAGPDRVFHMGDPQTTFYPPGTGPEPNIKVQPVQRALGPATNPNRSGQAIPLAPTERVVGTGKFAPAGTKAVRDAYYGTSKVTPNTESAIPKANVKETTEISDKINSPKDIIEKVNAKNKESKTTPNEDAKDTKSIDKETGPRKEETETPKPVLGKKWGIKKKQN